MPRNKRHKLRIKPKCLIHADLPEEAALAEFLFHNGYPFHKIPHIVRLATEVNDDPVLEGVMGDDVSSVGYNRVILGDGVDDIRLNRETFLGGKNQRESGQDNDDHKRPAEGIPPQFQKSLQSSACLPAWLFNPRASR